MKRILIQFDTDPQSSVFDRVVAVDAGVDELFSYHDVTPENVVALVHGAIFTRSPAELRHTAIFIGGSSASAGEAVLKAVQSAFFGPLRVSAMLDSNGSNTTAAGAVKSASRHVDLKGARSVVLGGTGPVGQRAAQILAMEGGRVRVVSRRRDKAEATCESIRRAVAGAELIPDQLESGAAALLQDADVLIAAGAAGAQLLSKSDWSAAPDLRVAIDLNAVPPAGLEGIAVTEKNVARGHVACYGAIGVGGLKMKVHKQAIEALFSTNDGVLDTASIFEIARAMA